MGKTNLSKREKIEKAVLAKLKKQTIVNFAGNELTVGKMENISLNSSAHFRPEGILMDSLEKCTGVTFSGFFTLYIKKGDGLASYLYDFDLKAELEYKDDDYSVHIIEPVTVRKHY